MSDDVTIKTATTRLPYGAYCAEVTAHHNSGASRSATAGSPRSAAAAEARDALRDALCAAGV